MADAESVHNPGDIPGVGGTAYDPETGISVTDIELESGDHEFAVTLPAELAAAWANEAEHYGVTIEEYARDVTSEAFEDLNDEKGN